MRQKFRRQRADLAARDVSGLHTPETKEGTNLLKF